MDNDSDSVTITASESDQLTKKPFEAPIFESVLEDKQRENSQDGNELGYNYDNLLKIANYKMRSKVKFPDNQFTQKQINKCEENRYKIKAIFQEHSLWLKNLKNQVNYNYYFTLKNY